MKILTLKNTSLEKIKLSKPELSDNIMYVDISNDSCPLYIQTPRMHVDIDNKKMSLLFDNEKLKEFYSFFVSIEKEICQKISENSEKWFPDKISYENVYKNFFISSLKRPDNFYENVFLSVNVPYDNEELKFEIYDRKNNKTNLDFLKDDDRVTVLLLANELVITKTNASIVWEVAQMKIHNKKEKKKYNIKKEKSENTEKKLKITLVGDVDSLDGYISE